MLAHLILTWIIAAVALLIVARVVDGIEVENFGVALISAVVIGLVNGILGPILRFFGFPLTLITLGLFSFVINGVLLQIAAAIVPGFRIKGCLPAILGAILMGLVQWGISWLLGF